MEKQSSSARAKCSPPYRVMQRPSDGQWCIYAPQANVVVAEFMPGAATDAKTIAKIFDPSGEAENKDSATGG